MRLTRRQGLLALCSSVLLVVCSYFYNNLPLFTGENLSCFALAEWTRHYFVDDAIDADSVLYINEAYDRALIPYREDGIEMGNTDITDRRKLLTLLQYLEKTDYRYIFMDIRFEEGCESPDPATDSALFAQIRQMDRIVVAQHRDVTNMNGVPQSKMALNDYYATLTTGLVRYQYLMGEAYTMPLYAYKELTGDSIQRHLGMLYTSGGHLCYNSLFLPFAPNNAQKSYVNLLGKDILDAEEPQENLKKMANGKMVFIGDFTHDLHDTYSGAHAGTEMIASAEMMLLDHKHRVNGWLTLFKFVLYFLLSLALFLPKRWYGYVPFLSEVRFPLLCFALSFLGFGAVLYVTSFLLGVFFRIYVSFLLPALWFSILSSYMDYKRAL